MCKSRQTNVRSREEPPCTEHIIGAESRDQDEREQGRSCGRELEGARGRATKKKKRVAESGCGCVCGGVSRAGAMDIVSATRWIVECYASNVIGVSSEKLLYDDACDVVDIVNKGSDQNLGSLFVDGNSGVLTKATGNVVESTRATNNVMFATEVTSMSIPTTIGSDIIPESTKNQKKLLADVTGNMVKFTFSINDTVSCMDSPIVQYAFIQSKFNSYVGAAGASASEPCKAKANFRSLYSDNLCNGVDFTIPRKVVERVSTHFENTVYGYFIGKRVAFSIVEYYMIRNIPVILKKWNMNSSLLIEELTRIMVWVKIHDFPLQVFSKDDIIKKDDVLKECISMGVPLIDDLGFSKEKVCIEYEGKLPCYETYKIFGHVHDQCPKYITVTPTPIVEKSNDGFQTASSGISKTVPSKKNQTPKASELPSSSRGSQNGKNGDPYAKENVTSPYDSSNIPVSNLYACLDEESEEEVENVFDEYANLLSSAKLGASSLPRVGEAAWCED
ncbi:zinc knuckle CX2CX4HX4C containing protein [Tanacetum coccineum]